MGKTTLLSRINEEDPIHYSLISYLIRKAGKNVSNSEKNTEYIFENQELWKNDYSE